MIEPETFRRRILDSLQLAASPTAQLDYARRVLIADVVAEVFELWVDIYHPRVPTFEGAFSPDERSALAEYDTVSSAIAASIGHLTLAECQASPMSRCLTDAAVSALAVLKSKTC